MVQARFLRLLMTPFHTGPPEVSELNQKLRLGHKLGKGQYCSVWFKQKNLKDTLGFVQVSQSPGNGAWAFCLGFHAVARPGRRNRKATLALYPAHTEKSPFIPGSASPNPTKGTVNLVWP